MSNIFILLVIFGNFAIPKLCEASIGRTRHESHGQNLQENIPKTNRKGLANLRAIPPRINLE
jgi:hypothetical protein